MCCVRLLFLLNLYLWITLPFSFNQLLKKKWPHLIYNVSHLAHCSPLLLHDTFCFFFCSCIYYKLVVRTLAWFFGKNPSKHTLSTSRYLLPCCLCFNVSHHWCSLGTLFHWNLQNAVILTFLNFVCWPGVLPKWESFFH